MTRRCDTFETFVQGAASHERSSHVTGLSTVRVAIGLARSVIEQAPAAEARSFTDWSAIAIAWASRRHHVLPSSILLGCSGAGKEVTHEQP